jgi:putative mRNA 3-end processing factor
MKPNVVEVLARGGIVLGGKVVCDGFFSAAPVRVQTHVHLDHMANFETSKGFQIILMSEATRELLVVEYDADLPFRSNIRSVPIGVPLDIGEANIELVSSGHMLGSVQVGVTYDDGLRVGYSGDFNWPLERVMRTDILVVDSTYGSPANFKKFTQEQVNSRLLELVIRRLKVGPVHVKAHRGTLERALELLDTNIAPILAPRKLCQEVEVYRRFGYHIQALLELDTVEGKSALASGRYLRLYGTGDGDLFGLKDGTAINLSAYMTEEDDPVLEFSERSFRVAMTCHADFKGTLEYIAATGAKTVITDNRRGGHAVELAETIKSQLGVEAMPSQYHPSRSWGE